MTHTPGPWDIQEYHEIGTGRLIVGTNTVELAYIPQQCTANAQLIAAAPDLLAALEQYRDAIAELQESGFSSTAVAAWTRLGQIDTRAKRLIAKAKGIL